MPSQQRSARLVVGLCFAQLFVGCASSPSAEQATTPTLAQASMRSCRAVEMPEQLVTEDAHLLLNGMAVKRVTALGIAVFVSGLYLEHETRDFDGLLTSPQHRRLVLRFVRRVSASQLRNGIGGALRRNVGEGLAGFERDVERLEGALTGMRAGDELVFDQRADVRFTMLRNSERVAEFEPAFAEVCLLAFLGRQGNLGLRNGLIGGICNE